MLQELKDFFSRTAFYVSRHTSKVKPWLVVLLAVLIVVVLSLSYYLHFLATPYGNGGRIQVFDFSSGYTMKKISEELAASRIIRNAALFSLHARFENADEKIQAGSYRFSDGMTPVEILAKLVNGEVFEVRFSVPEGYSIFQIGELLEKRKLIPKENFLRQCRNHALLHELDIPTKSVEGFLSPRTYIIRPDTDAKALIKEMVEQFRAAYNFKFAARARSLGLSELEVLTLASMIDKEAVVPAERPLIASVFHNRLKRNIPLQSDPTAVYGIRAFAGKISKQDILRETPYNTYRIKGLPPGPIGNPGEESIKAVLFPAQTQYLYFVARKDGTHQFSTTLAEHNRAVEKYLK
ncbi:MAG: endolytic transglycosylase MltG [Deltaproteobacteria bacterium]|nr:endolytic transglycosylase MltG [Deltaproteobacteria bacterium]